MKFIGNKTYEATQKELDALPSIYEIPQDYEPSEGDMFRGQSTADQSPMIIRYYYHPLNFASSGLAEQWFRVKIVKEEN